MNKHDDSSSPQPRGGKCPQPHCGSDRVVCNGSYQTKNRGLARRRVCRACGHSWTEFGNQSQLLGGTRINGTESVVLRAFALVCIGLPLAQVEGLLGRKSETISGWLQVCFAKPELWSNVIQHLASDFAIATKEAETLSELLSRSGQSKASFHSHSRRQLAAAWKPKRRRRMPLTAAQLAQLFAAPHLSHLSEEEAAIEKLETKRRFEKPRPQPLTEVQKMESERVQQRIEHVLGARVVRTPDGDFYHWDDDRRVVAWLGEVEHFNSTEGEKLLKLLFPVEQLVFTQVRQPNQEAHLCAKLEGARGMRPDDPWPEKMTPYCLAAGLGFDYGGFIDNLKSLAGFLRSSGSSDQAPSQ